MSRYSITRSEIFLVSMTLRVLTKVIVLQNYLKNSTRSIKVRTFRERCLDETHTTLALAICCSYSGSTRTNSSLSTRGCAFPISRMHSPVPIQCTINEYCGVITKHFGFGKEQPFSQRLTLIQPWFLRKGHLRESNKIMFNQFIDILWCSSSSDIQDSHICPMQYDVSDVTWYLHHQGVCRYTIEVQYQFVLQPNWLL